MKCWVLVCFDLLSSYLSLERRPNFLNTVTKTNIPFNRSIRGGKLAFNFFKLSLAAIHNRTLADRFWNTTPKILRSNRLVGRVPRIKQVQVKLAFLKTFEDLSVFRSWTFRWILLQDLISNLNHATSPGNTRSLWRLSRLWYNFLLCQVTCMII